MSHPSIEGQSSDRRVDNRASYPALGNKLYLNYGGQGPLSQLALTAMQTAYLTSQELGPFSGAADAWAVQEAQKTREMLAQELGVTSETIALTENTSVGCNIVLWGLDWQPSDHILLSDCEYPGILAVVQRLQERFGIEVSSCPIQGTLNTGNPVDAVVQHLRPQTRLVVLSHILWNTGQCLPLAEIAAACRANTQWNDRPPLILIDAAQSVGVLPLNLTEMGIDFYAFTGHKWWCGPDGVGGLYIRPDRLDWIKPTFISWRGIQLNAQGEVVGWRPNAQRFEVATSAVPLWSGLRTAIELHRQWGTASDRHQRILSLSRLLWQKLMALPKVHCLSSIPPKSGLVTFQVLNHSPADVVRQLEAHQCFVRLIRNPACVRACTHYFTLESEVDTLVALIDQLF